MKAVESGGTSIGIKCKDGIVLAVEKIINSKLLVPNANKRIQTIDSHIGIVYSGLLPDGRHLTSRGRDESKSFRSLYKSQIPVPSLVDKLGIYVQNYTCYNSVRPFGIVSIIGGIDSNGPHLHMMEPSGAHWGYQGAATGKGRQIAKSELEKIDFKNILAKDAINIAAKIIHLAHEDNKDKDYELEISWVTNDTGKNHVFVSQDLVDNARKLAEDEDDDDDDDEIDVDQD